MIRLLIMERLSRAGSILKRFIPKTPDFDQRRRDLLKKEVQGGVAALLVLGVPSALILAINSQYDLLEKEISEYRYEVRMSKVVRVPPLAFLMPPLVRPGYDKTVQLSYFTNVEPEIEETDGISRLKLRDTLYYDQGSAKRFQQISITKSPNVSIIDRFPQVRNP